MKNFLSGVFLTVIVLATVAPIALRKISDVDGKQWIVAPQFLTLQKGVTKEEARRWMEKRYLPIFRNYPGWNAILGEPTSTEKWGLTNNSTQEKADFVLIFVFDSPEKRNHLFPPGKSWSEAIQKATAKHKPTSDDFFGKYFEQDKNPREEFTMFASAK